MTYARARKDFEYLETLEEFEDQITILDQVQDFMKNPTKAFAMDLYICSIHGWLNEQRHSDHMRNRKVKTIIRRYNAIV